MQLSIKLNIVRCARKSMEYQHGNRDVVHCLVFKTTTRTPIYIFFTFSSTHTPRGSFYSSWLILFLSPLYEFSIFSTVQIWNTLNSIVHTCISVGILLVVHCRSYSIYALFSRFFLIKHLGEKSLFLFFFRAKCTNHGQST